ncbi:hypothetical protein TNCV_3579641 [Trichonephila clavipes]|nr:hypothetical protein TNCV_3579641 [Trichonephila clavipes]
MGSEKLSDCSCISASLVYDVLQSSIDSTSNELSLPRIASGHCLELVAIVVESRLSSDAPENLPYREADAS